MHVKISKAAAKASGLKRYYTGHLCPHNHRSERYLSGHCVECRATADRKWRKDNPEKTRARHRAYCRKWRKDNPEKVRAYAIKWREANPEKSRAQDLASTRKWQKNNSEKVRITAHKSFMKRCEVSERLALSPINEILHSDIVVERHPGQHTDHIRPLFGKYVWGFDAPYNIENIDAAANRAKSNKDPSDAQLLSVSRIKSEDLPPLNAWLQGVADALEKTKHEEFI